MWFFIFFLGGTELANEKIDALTSEIEQLKAKQQEQIDKADIEDIRLANEKINTLTLEIEEKENWDGKVNSESDFHENSFEKTKLKL